MKPYKIYWLGIEKNQIYADMAYRLGKIVTQYEKMNVGEFKDNVFNFNLPTPQP